MQRAFWVVAVLLVVGGLVGSTVAATAAQDAPDEVEVGEEFQVSISSANWVTDSEDSSETYDGDPCYGPGIDVGQRPELVYTSTHVDVVGGDGEWTYAGGVIGYEWSAPVEAVEAGTATLQFAVKCADGSRDPVSVEVEVEGVDDGGGSGDDGGDGSTPTPPGNNGGDGDGGDDSGEGEDDGLLDTVISGITDSARQTWIGIITEAVMAVVYDPFQSLAHSLLEGVMTVLTWTPDVHPNPAVEDMHQRTLAVALMLAFLGIVVTGLLYQVGPLFGVSYQEVRWLLPRLIVAVLFATISLPILQLFVDLTNALVVAFQPPEEYVTPSSWFGAGVASVLVWVVNALVLVAVFVAYIIRDVYILFIAAISPLIAVAWAMPRTQRYARAFISGWWVALAMGPLAMLVLTFVFALMSQGGETVGQAVGNWVFGVAGFVLLLLLPYQLYGAATAITSQAFRTVDNLERGVRRRYRARNGDEDQQISEWQPSDAPGDGSPPDWWYTGDEIDDGTGGRS